MLSMGRAVGGLAPCGMLACGVVCGTMRTLRPVVWMGTAVVIARRQRQWGADNDRGSIGHLGVCACVARACRRLVSGEARAQGRRDGTSTGAARRHDTRYLVARARASAVESRTARAWAAWAVVASRVPAWRGQVGGQRVPMFRCGTRSRSRKRTPARWPCRAQGRHDGTRPDIRVRVHGRWQPSGGAGAARAACPAWAVVASRVPAWRGQAGQRVRMFRCGTRSRHATERPRGGSVKVRVLTASRHPRTAVSACGVCLRWCRSHAPRRGTAPLVECLPMPATRPSVACCCKCLWCA